MTFHVANRGVRVSSEGGTVSQPLNGSAHFSVTINLAANQTNHVTVCIYNISCPSPDACMRVDASGNPLNIVQTP